MPEGEGAEAAGAPASAEVDAAVTDDPPLPEPSPSPLKSPDADEDEAGDNDGATSGPAASAAKEKKKKEKKEKLGLNAKVKDKTMCPLKHEELDWIWIGDAEDARDCVALRKHGVKYILNCTPTRNNGGVANFHERDPNFQYCRLAMGDNATEQLKTRYEAAWDFFEKVRIREDGGVLVHCQQGVSRSVSMVVCYLMKYYRFTWEDAIKLCRTSRKQANPNEGFTEQLRELEEELRRTNGYEKVPPKRKKLDASSVEGASAPKRPNVGPARGPAPQVGPPRGPQGPSRGPVGPTVGPSMGPARGPTVGPQVGPQVGPVGPPVGPTAGPVVGPTVGPSVAGPAAPDKEKKKKGAIGPAKPK